MANSIIITKEQREILKKLSFYAIMLMITTSICLYLGTILEERERKHTWLKNDIAELGHKLEGLNKKTLEFSEAVNTWESLSEDDKKLQGLRINDAKEMLEELQKKYNFTSVKTSFSKPTEIAGDYKTDTVNMVSSIISMNFNSFTDENIYNFVNEIMHNFPGYVQIKSISINKPTTINKDILKKISTGDDVTVIPVSIDFYWHDLKYKGPATPQSQAPEGGTPVK